MSLKRPVNFIVMAVFLVSLVVPFVVWLVPGLEGSQRLVEKRELAERPHIAEVGLAGFPKQFEKYYDDHFGFRTELVRLNSLVRYRAVGVSSTPRVVAGSEGWLFYTGDDLFSYHTGRKRLSDDELESWRSSLELKRNWLAAQGIAYLLVVAPNKASIYPELLPPGYDVAMAPNATDDLMAYLSRESSVEILDLRPVLREGKIQGQLYYRLDSHWTTLGSYLAYTAISNRISEMLSLPTGSASSDTCRGRLKRNGGDLVSMLGLDGDLREVGPNIYPCSNPAQVIGERGAFRDPFVMGSVDPTMPRGVMFRDSFGTVLNPFVADDFSWLELRWEYWDDDASIGNILAETAPRIVIEEIVERKLFGIRELTKVPPLLQGLGRKTVVYRADGDLLVASDFVALKDVSLMEGQEGLVAHATGRDPCFLLPQMKLDGRPLTIFQFEVSSPSATSFQLFYQTDRQEYFDERKSVRSPVDKGFNLVQIPVYAADLNGVVRIDPGSVPGDYRFSSVQVFNFVVIN